MIRLNFKDVWNASVNKTDRPMVARDYAWASEMGKSLCDRYLAMKGTAPTNPPNMRSRRKFFAGNVWEFVAGLVLYQLGVVIPQQQEVWVEDAPIRVKGKLDYLIGGIPNYSFARDSIRAFPFQKEMTDRFLKTIDFFEEKIGSQELYPIVHEIKSCSQYVIEHIAEGGNIIGHDLQLYHYLRGLNMDEGHLCYISKDDALMEEVVIQTPNSFYKAKYDTDLGTLKGYLDANEMPRKEPLLVFEGKFKKNFNIEYSNYLTLVYGYKEPMDYSNDVKSQIQRWNNVLKRIQLVGEGKRNKPTKSEPLGALLKLTDKNKLVIDEMAKAGLDAYKLSEKAKVEEDEDDETT
jgi:hypothetical protein